MMAHGIHCSSVCNNEELQGVALSLVPAGYTNADMNVKLLTKLFNWFKSFVTFESDEEAAVKILSSNNSLVKATVHICVRKSTYCLPYTFIHVICVFDIYVIIH